MVLPFNAEPATSRQTRKTATDCNYIETAKIKPRCSKLLSHPVILVQQSRDERSAGFPRGYCFEHPFVADGFCPDGT